MLYNAGDMITFAERLKELREKRGLLQKAVASDLNIGNTTLSNYEQNVSSPQSRNADRYSRLFRHDRRLSVGQNRQSRSHRIRGRTRQQVIAVVQRIERRRQSPDNRICRVFVVQIQRAQIVSAPRSALKGGLFLPLTKSEFDFKI